MSETTVWMNTPAQEFDWEAEAFYAVQSAENIAPHPKYADVDRIPGQEWYYLPMPADVSAEFEKERHTRKEWAIRSAEWYAEKYPNTPIRVVRQTFEMDTA